MDIENNTDPAAVLRRALYVDQAVKALEAEQRQMEEMLQSLQSFDYQKPIVKSSAGRGDVERLAIQAADGKARIARKISQLLEAKEEARALIETLPEGPERNVLTGRYLLLQSWEQVAVELGYSYRHVIRLHGEALRRLREAEKKAQGSP